MVTAWTPIHLALLTAACGFLFYESALNQATANVTINDEVFVLVFTALLQSGPGCNKGKSMTLSLLQKITAGWAVLTHRYDQRIDSARGRWQGQFYAATLDHGWLRRRWTNEGQIAEGLYRANHPNAAMLAKWQGRGIKQVISLRRAKGAVHNFEAETCEALGLTLSNAPLASREAPSVKGLVLLLDIFDRLQTPGQLPALLHCKSGADRTGLAAAIWAIYVEGRPVSEAKGALSCKHLHVRASKTGVLDRFLEAYEARLTQGPIDLRTWIETEYNPASL